MKKSLLFCGVVALLFCASCHSEKHHETETPILTVTSPLEQDTILYQEYVSQIHSLQHIELRALERGYLRHVLNSANCHQK